MEMEAPLRRIKGVGEKSEQLFQKLGVCTVGDILLYFPRTYEQYPKPEVITESQSGERIAFEGVLKSPAKTHRGKRMEVTSALVYDRNGTAVECVFFRMPYLSSRLHVGETLVWYGKLERRGQKWCMEQPKFFSFEQYETLMNSYQPIYPLTQGISNAMVRKLLHGILDSLTEEERLADGDLPETILRREGFCSYLQALEQVHFPENFSQLEEGRNRLVYQEFFYFILHSRIRQFYTTGVENPWALDDTGVVERTLKGLPYTLTTGQKETLEQIRNDLRGPVVSQRLIQGDVGSGKTIVAFLAMLDVVSQGYQAAIMAPTEVLARQHEETFQELCRQHELPYETVCLVGSMTQKEKNLAYEKIRTNPGLFIVGTHALIQDKVQYRELALVVTDEQHRFGVKQRERLSQKGKTPHILVMSATPIPRTLAMILYSNMQISTIRERPSHRLKIKTCVIRENMRKQAYQMIAKEIQEGHQAYIICPLVSAGETTEAENVLDYVKKIGQVFDPDVVIRGLHGKMLGKEKNQIMEDFASRKIHILVSTTVVEVGINVPNAAVILIENAESFGLAQLHQLRGRVGRGQWQSYCILMDQSKKEEGAKRLDVMNRSDDGFFIAEEDLRLRGPGDFFGIRQSGDLNFRLADIIGDAKFLHMAAEDVQEILRKDPDMLQYPQIKNKLGTYEEENGYVL